MGAYRLLYYDEQILGVDTTMTAKWRFVGTLHGAICAFICWDVTDGNPYALASTGFVFLILHFYIIYSMKRNNPFGS